MTRWPVVTALMAASCLAAASGDAWQDGRRPAVFSRAQAEAGRTAFGAHCAACHGRDLSGSEAPPLAGAGFYSTWKTQSTAYLLKYVQEMPPGGPPLTLDDYVAVAAFILQQNGAVSGDEPLTAATDVPIGSVATGERPPE